MKNKVILSSVFLLLFFTSCKNEKESEIKQAQETVVETPVESQKKTDKNAINYRLLQGKWQSVEDKKSYIMYDSDLQYTMYEGYENNTGYKYVISDVCLLDIDKKGTAEKDKYITVPEVSQCLYIIKVSTDSLIVSNVDRGNTLKYIRVN